MEEKEKLYEHYGQEAYKILAKMDKKSFRDCENRDEFSNYMLNVYIAHYGLRCTCGEIQDWDFNNASSHYQSCDLWRFCHILNRSLDWAEHKAQESRTFKVKPCYDAEFKGIKCLAMEDQFGFFRSESDFRPGHAIWIKNEDLKRLFNLFSGYTGRVSQNLCIVTSHEIEKEVNLCEHCKDLKKKGLIPGICDFHLNQLVLLERTDSGNSNGN